MTTTEGQTTTVAALRDATFYECPAGHGPNPTPRKYHVIADRPEGSRWGGRGPACGIPLHDEMTETPANLIDNDLRCQRPGCRHRWADITPKERHS